MSFWEIYLFICDYLHKRDLYMNRSLTFDNKYQI